MVLALTWHYNFRKRLQLAVGSGRNWPDGKCSSGQFLRRNSLVIVVHEINVPFVRHSRLEDGRFGITAEPEFQLGPDDARFDETVARFAFKVMVQRHGDADDPAGKTADADAPLDLLQLDIVREIVSLNKIKISKMLDFNISIFNWSLVIDLPIDGNLV